MAQSYLTLIPKELFGDLLSLLLIETLINLMGNGFTNRRMLAFYKNSLNKTSFVGNQPVLSLPVELFELGNVLGVKDHFCVLVNVAALV